MFTGFSILPVNGGVDAVRHPVIDLNRDSVGGSLYPGRFETGLCPLTDFDRKDIYKPDSSPDDASVELRLELYWRPYHTQLRKVLDQGRHASWSCPAHRRPIPFVALSPACLTAVCLNLNFGTNSGQALGPLLASRP
ncbi:MAG: N-formylglutamate amidohydrolase [Asticcacaulis sp.]